MTFSEKLKTLRDATGLTQAALSIASGLSLGVIHDYEQGKREPTLRSAVKLADALGISVEAFADSARDGEAKKPGPPKARSSGAKRSPGRPRKGK